MKHVLRVSRFIATVFAWISMIALVVMVAITVIDVFCRNVFNSPITGTTEVARMMMICMIAAIPLALLDKHHISVEILVDRFGRKGQLAFDTFGYLLSTIACSLMSYQGYLDMLVRLQGNHTYSLLKFPTWPFYLVFSLSTGAFAVFSIVSLVDNYMNKDLYLRKKSTDDIIESMEDTMI